MVYVPTAATYPTTGPAVLTLTGGKTATGPNFTITAPGGTTAPAPTISGYTNTSGGAITAATAGTSIKVVGANLGTSGTVTFNGISATPSAWSTTAVTVTVPSAATYPNTGPVRVTTGGQTATGANFTINAPPTTVAVPTISGYTNTSGGALTAAVPGTSVKIVGTNFGTTGTVTFNGISAAPTSWTSTAITVSVPTAATYPNTGPVRVTSNGQTGTGANFTINAPPVTAAVPTISSYTNLSGVRC